MLLPWYHILDMAIELGTSHILRIHLGIVFGLSIAYRGMLTSDGTGSCRRLRVGGCQEYGHLLSPLDTGAALYDGPKKGP